MACISYLLVWHFWRNQSGITFRNGFVGVGLLDRSILCITFVFCWSHEACHSNSNLHRELVCPDWNTAPHHHYRFGRIYCRTRLQGLGWLSVGSTQENANDTKVSKTYRALHNMPKMSKFGHCLKETLKKTAAIYEAGRTR